MKCTTDSSNQFNINVYNRRSIIDELTSGEVCLIIMSACDKNSESLMAVYSNCEPATEDPKIIMYQNPTL